MVMTDSSAAITTKDAQDLERASSALISSIREAVRAFHASAPEGWERWERQRTPKPWEERALPNLADYHRALQQAIRSHVSGDIEPITRMASCYAALSKDLDFATEWMTSADRADVDAAVDNVTSIADRIHRAGYAAL
jgi:hypothetical protein